MQSEKSEKSRPCQPASDHRCCGDENSLTSQPGQSTLQSWSEGAAWGIQSPDSAPWHSPDSLCWCFALWGR